MLEGHTGWVQVHLPTITVDIRTHWILNFTLSKIPERYLLIRPSQLYLEIKHGVVAFGLNLQE